jgi:hypothetical protein
MRDLPPADGWTVDDGLAVHTYRIDPEHEIYCPSGTFTDEIGLDEPWPIRLPLARLRPRHL